jgi:hypothetical protein
MFCCGLLKVSKNNLMAKKSKVDVGKGFKRIFYVIAAVWVATM